jgi:hypothetical protein
MDFSQIPFENCIRSKTIFIMLHEMRIQTISIFCLRNETIKAKTAEKTVDVPQ